MIFIKNPDKKEIGFIEKNLLSDNLLQRLENRNMPITAFHELLKQAELLSRKEQLLLAVRLINRGHPYEMPLPKWKDIRGSVPYPALGEDAQKWVSRNRAESDAEREKQWLKP